MTSVIGRLLAVGATVFFFSNAQAQVAPSATEYAAYTGLHAAAAKGDIAAIARLGANKAKLNDRDAYGRTPLMLAAYAKRHAAAKALIATGADLDAFENDRYDAVTIASVANDVAMLKIALEAGAKAGQTTSRYDGTALIAAAHLGHAEVVRTLIKAGAPRLVEYNARFGDPECQVLMMRLGGQILDLLLASAEARLDNAQVNWANDHALTVVMAANGYPGAYEKGNVIKGLDALPEDSMHMCFHAGTTMGKDGIEANGGRVLNVTARGDSLQQARDRAYALIDQIDWPDGFYRPDIGWKALQ